MTDEEKQAMMDAAVLRLDAARKVERQALAAAIEKIGGGE